MTTIGERILESMNARGIKRKALAEASGLSYSALSDLIQGRSHTSRKLHRIAAALGVHVNWLETGRGEQWDATASMPEPEPAGDPWAALEELRVAQVEIARVLADSIPTAGRALADALAKLPDDLAARPYLATLTARVQAALARHELDALRAPARKARGSD